MDFKAVISKRIDLKGLILEDVIEGLVFEKLSELAARSDNNLDDAILAFAKPEVVKFCEEQIDSAIAKYVSPEPEAE